MKLGVREKGMQNFSTESFKDKNTIKFGTILVVIMKYLCSLMFSRTFRTATN